MAPPQKKNEKRQEKSQLKSINPNILEGKSLEAIYAFPLLSMCLCVCFFNIRIEMGPVNSSDSDLPVNSITQGPPGCLSARPEPWPCLNS